MGHFPDYIKVTMPSHFYPDDGAWIQEMLGKLRVSTRAKITAKYSEVYQAAWDEEPVSYRKDNAARRAANIRLREFVVKYERAAQGYTSEPLKVVNP
ncbi:hypothetical protein [Xenorhabdus thuongxuanensis]|uniref:Uncharacterized protein n=1 Tax=Xenorhabdus thuongxuanensis TaxID=1873484 RepID=A0A1Q5TMT2_9GAMM|nr:hypothetical protein [Xenorhabdus thuongxuanensis]OKP01528.1 hypothetical protein Xentx_03401 [Xenorhabdus thuongxuanensis]